MKITRHITKPVRKIIGLIFILSLFIALPLVVYLSQQQQDVRTRATASGPYLTLDPASGTKTINQPLTVDVYIFPQGQSIGAIEMHILFDASKLELDQRFVPTNATNPVVNLPDNPNPTSNEITYVGTAPALTPITQNTKIGTIVFTPKTAGPTTVNFGLVRMIAPGQSDYLALGQHISATYSIVQGTIPTTTDSLSQAPAVSGDTPLALTLTLDGVGGADGNRQPRTQNRTVKIQLFDANNLEVANKTGTVAYNTTTGKFTGTVNMGAVPTGNYIVKITSPMYLTKIVGKETNQILRPITSGTNTAIPDSQLNVGDANNDNILNALDFNILRDCKAIAANPPPTSTTECITKADFNNDGIVNQKDFTWFVKNVSNRSGD